MSEREVLEQSFLDSLPSGENPFDPKLEGLSQFELRVLPRCLRWLRECCSRASTIQADRAIDGRPMRPVDVGLISGDAIKCRVWANPSTDYFHIGITSGFVMLVIDTCCRLMALQSNLFPSVGHLGMQSGSVPVVMEREYWELKQRRAPYYSELRDVIPVSFARLRLALRIAKAALEALMFHEVCHVRHGHLQLRNADTEIRNCAKATRAMEFDADAYAASETFRPLVEMYCECFGYGTAKEWVRFRAFRDDAIRVWVCAQCVRFWLTSLKNQTEGVHRTPVQRLADIFGSIFTLLAPAGSEVERPIYDLMFPTAIDTTAALSALGFKDTYEKTGILLYLINDGTADEVKKTWLELRPLLLKHSHVSNLP